MKKLFRKANTVNTYAQDDAEIATEFTSAGQVRISFTTGSSGGRSDFLLTFEGHELPALAYMCHVAMMDSLDNKEIITREPTDVEIDTRIKALLNKLGEDNKS